MAAHVRRWTTVVIAAVVYLDAASATGHRDQAHEDRANGNQEHTARDDLETPFIDLLAARSVLSEESIVSSLSPQNEIENIVKERHEEQGAVYVGITETAQKTTFLEALSTKSYNRFISTQHSVRILTKSTEPVPTELTPTTTEPTPTPTEPTPTSTEPTPTVTETSAPPSSEPVSTVPSLTAPPIGNTPVTNAVPSTSPTGGVGELVITDAPSTPLSSVEGSVIEPTTGPADFVTSLPRDSNAGISDPTTSATKETPTTAPATKLPLFDVPTASETVEPQTVTTAETLAKIDEKALSSHSEAPARSVGNDEPDWEETAEPEKYIRGQTSINDVSDPWREITGSHGDNTPAHSPPMVIGGRQRGLVNLPGTPYSQFGTLTHDIVRYISSAAGAVSLALLIAFHFLSLDPGLRSTRLSWSPNTWEFGIYAAYLQQMTSMSQLTLIKSPYFLWDFTDAFAWVNFLLQKSTSHPEPQSRRRLEAVLILDGLVGYADRIGLKETKILLATVFGFLVTMALLVAAFAISALVARHKNRSCGDQAGSDVWSVPHRLLGLCWLVWFFGLFPLGVMSAFEMYMEIHSNLLSVELLLTALFAMSGLCIIPLALLVRSLLFRSRKELREYRCIAVYGMFYLDKKYETRLFFVLSALVQFFTGVLIGVLNSNSSLLTTQIVLHSVFIVAVMLFKPFKSRTVTWVTLLVEILKIVNISIGFQFLPGRQMSANHRIMFANIFIGVNATVLLLWFLRHLVIFAHAVRAVLRHWYEADLFYRDNLDLAKYHAQATPEVSLEPVPTAAPDPSTDGSVTATNLASPVSMYATANEQPHRWHPRSSTHAAMYI